MSNKSANTYVEALACLVIDSDDSIVHFNLHTSVICVALQKDQLGSRKDFGACKGDAYLILIQKLIIWLLHTPDCARDPGVWKLQM